MHLLFAWSCARGHGCYKCEQSRIAFQILSEREKGLKADINIAICVMSLCLFVCFLVLHWALVAVHRLSLVVVSRGYSVAVCGLLIAVASLVVAHRLQVHTGFSSCGLQALELGLYSCGSGA